MRNKQKFFFIFSIIISIITITFCLTYNKKTYAMGEIFKIQNLATKTSKLYLVTNHKFPVKTSKANIIINNNQEMTLKNINLVKKNNKNYIYNINNWINTDYVKCKIVLKSEPFISYLIKKTWF